MRLSLLSVAVLALGAIASPLKEESMMTVGLSEKIGCDGSHFLVSVQRTDDIKEDTGELIAEKISKVVFDFKVDRDAETLLINGCQLKLVPQVVSRLKFFAAVLPSDHPGLPSVEDNVALSHPAEVEAFSKLQRNEMITANVDLFVMYEGDMRQIGVHVQVIEIEGKAVIHKDILTAQITVPRISEAPHGHAQSRPASLPVTTEERPGPPESEWKSRLSAWLNMIHPHRPCNRGGRRPARPQEEEEAHYRGHRGQYHRHRFSRPHHVFRRFVVTVLVPIFIGAAAGVAIGVVSVLIAEVIGGLIARVRGEQEPDYIEIDVKDDDESDEDLPVYEELGAAPEYRDEKQ